MKFLNLRAKNFMSFEELDCIIPQSGLYFVGGEVQDGGMSNSNGAGKSALFEALCYGLFGKTIRGVSADDIINRDKKEGCFVEVIMEDDEGKACVVQRYRGDKKYHNDLYLYKSEVEDSENKDDDLTGSDVFATQRTIDSILGMNWLVLSTIVIFGEKAKRFIEAGDADKKEVFDEILMWHCYLLAQKEANADLKTLMEKKSLSEIECDKIRASLSEIRFEFQAIEEKLEENKKEKEAIAGQIEEKTASVVDLDEELKTAKSASAEAKDDLGTLEEEDKKILKIVEDLRKEESEEMSKLKEVNLGAYKQLTPVVVKVEDIEKWLGKKDELPEGERCPFCGVEVTEDTIEECTKHYEKKLEELNPKKKELEAAYEEASKKEKEATEKWLEKFEETGERKSKLDKELSTQQEIIRDSESSVLRIENQVALIRKEIEHMDSDCREKDILLLQSKERLEKKAFDHEEGLEKLEKEMAEAEEEAKYLKFWVEGFSGRGIKSLLLDEILPQLNTKADYYGSVLLDNEIRMEFDTEAILKSGDVRDKFNIKLFFRSRANPVDYKTCSSGEKGRIDAAVLLALQSLIFERSNCSSSLIVFDEIFEHLDSVGIERMVNLLSEEAEDKAIFVISHQN